MCDFVELTLDGNGNKITNIQFACLSGWHESTFPKEAGSKCKKECSDTVKKKYCRNTNFFNENKELIERLQLIVEKFRMVKTTKRIPIFRYSFFFDFLIWQKLMGEDLYISGLTQHIRESRERGVEMHERGAAL